MTGRQKWATYFNLPERVAASLDEATIQQLEACADDSARRLILDVTEKMPPRKWTREVQREYMKTYNRERKARLKTAGLCVDCGNEIKSIGHFLCLRCRCYRAESNRRRYAETKLDRVLLGIGRPR